MEKTLKDWSAEQQDTKDHNGLVISEFRKLTDSIPQLKEHRDFIEYHQREAGFIYGHGDRSLQYLWKLVVDELPENFSFLEIGVYKGQILSLVQMLANMSKKQAKIIGVTPLFDPDFANYDRLPYIKNLFKKFGLTMENTTIVDGFSQIKEVIEKVDAAKGSGYDVVYVDGDHSYAVTASDIQNYGKMIRPGGFLVVDDCNNFKQIPDGTFSGIQEVSLAVCDNVENNPRYKEVLTCMHVRVWQVQEGSFELKEDDFWGTI